MHETKFAIVIISNGPGELSTWVKPLVEELHSKLDLKPIYEKSPISINLVLVPCPNATGKEKFAAQNWDIFEKIISAKNFWQLLLRPKKYASWPSKGLVIFLGGDQFWSVLLSARLKYRHITYAEWVARWPFWNDRILAMSEKVLFKVPKKLRDRCNVVGNLMADINRNSKKKINLPEGRWIALMPGSKSAKLRIGIPFFLEVADKLSQIIPECKFLLPIAPTTNIKELLHYGGPQNAIAKNYTSSIKKVAKAKDAYKLIKLTTNKETDIYLQEDYPAYENISNCELALTTIGANTAELGALAVPMIVVVPTQHLSVMQAWDGFIGVIARLPLLKSLLGRLLSYFRLRKGQYMAWPNISSKKMIVPERIGNILPEHIAKEASELLVNTNRLESQKENLIRMRGKTGAVSKMAREIIKLINYLE